jgi:hypothetical protein
MPLRKDEEQSIIPDNKGKISKKELARDFIKAAGDFAEYIGDVEQGKAPFEPFDDLTKYFKANVEQLYHVSLDGTPTTPEQRQKNLSSTIETINRKAGSDPNNPYAIESSTGYETIIGYLAAHHNQYPKVDIKQTEIRVAKMLVRTRDHVKNNPPKPPQA